MVHADFSRKGAFLRMAEIFPDQESNYENRKFDLIKYVPETLCVRFD